MKSNNLILAATLIFLAVSSTANAQVQPQARDDEEFARRAEITTRMNAYLLQIAVDAFAEQNGGIYPGSLYDNGRDRQRTVRDFLPGGELMLNRFTLDRTEPVDDHAASPGQIGYLVIVDACGNNVGYSINAWGRISEIISIDRIGSPDLCPEPADAEASADASEPSDPDDSSE